MTGALMRGGVDVDESTLNDDANYWKSGARHALVASEVYVNCNHPFVDNCRIGKVVSVFWNRNNTWKHICLKTERMLHLIKLLCKENNNAQ